jgi:hypothetical protein
MQVFVSIVATVAFSLSASAFAQGSSPSTLTDAQVRERIIKESIANYSGSCPCPYNTARNGSRCGGRSAYSRPGGQAPICYSEDISDDMVRRYRSNMK